MNQRTDQTAAEPAKLCRRAIRRGLLLVAACLGAALLASSVVFVDESEYVIIERFGNIRDDGSGVYDRPEDRGLHFKLPWPVEIVRRYDSRLQILDPPAREIHTQKKRNIVIDSYICWKIAGSPTGSQTPADQKPVVRFFRALIDRERAESRLNTRMWSILPAEIGKITLSDLLNADSSTASPKAEETGLLERVSADFRDHVIQQPGEEQSLLDRFGIEVVDVRIKRVALPAGNRQAVYVRMRSDRKKETNKERYEGLAQKQVIEGYAKRQYEEILARARADAERIRGDGEASALETLNTAYAKDREFYRVVRTLESYRKILNDRTTLVLSASSNLMKLLTEGVPKTAEPASNPGDTPTSDPTPGADAEKTTPSTTSTVPDKNSDVEKVAP